VSCIIKTIFMTKFILTASIGACLFLSSCDTLESVASTIVNSGSVSGNTALTNEEVVGGLKEALNVGIKNSVNLTAVTDGFLKNDEIRLPFPQDAIKVREKAIEWGMAGQVEKFETTLN